MSHVRELLSKIENAKLTLVILEDRQYLLLLAKCREPHDDHNGRWECDQDGNGAEDCFKRDRHLAGDLGLQQSVTNVNNAKSILRMEELI